MSAVPLFLRACAGQPCERPPIWIMRQAGRYLAGYRQIRQKNDFLAVCRTPELACEVTLQPIERFGLDAAILFSDIMVPLESMGVSIDFAPGPIIAKPLRGPADVAALREPHQDEIAPFVGEAIRLLRRALSVPLIGFAGAPWTLAAYLIEGRGSKDFALARSWVWRDPQTLVALLDKLTTMIVRYLRHQVMHGAQAIQLFDSWAGLLDRYAYEAFVLPSVQRIFAELKDLGVPRIFYVHNAAHLLPVLAHVDAEVLGLDWRTDLKTARDIVGNQLVLQGNLDPTALLAPPDAVQRAATAVLDAGGGQRHIFNLGHGILPPTPEASVEALVSTVREYAHGPIA